MTQFIHNYKYYLPQVIYFIVSLILWFIFNNILASNTGTLNYQWAAYTPTFLVMVLQWFILIYMFDFPKEIITDPRSSYLPTLIFFILHQFVSFLIVNALTLIFTRKTLKQLLGN